MPFAQTLLLTIYYGLLLLVSAVMLYRAALIFRYFLKPRGDEAPKGRFDEEPLVTVQLPVFNEQFVVDRLLETVAALDWPKDKLEIQLLDDSTDETVEISAAKVAELQRRGFDAVHVHRTDRTGYKAGALREATEVAKGEYLAVFDADFVPRPDFLRQTVDHFTDETVAFVQTRWSYLNRSYGFLTQGMGMLMDGHFVLEQVTRSRGGYLFNFNGTGGIWRRKAITDAGGWHDDTICEDTDLSYRAQLAGYRGVFLRDVDCPSELPVQITALKSQQHRWAKGLTECFFKLMPTLWRSTLPLRKKLEGSFHLGANLAFPASLFMTVVALPVMLVRMGRGAGGEFAQFMDSFVFFLVAITQVLFYIVATRESHKDWLTRLKYLPFFPLIGVGLAVNNARGVLEAMSGLRTEFVRTPKLGVLGSDRNLVKRRERTYTGGRAFWQAVVEIFLGAYYVWMAAAQLRVMPMGSFVTLVLSLGLFTMGGATLRAIAIGRAEARARLAAELA
ncbi:MAG: glycosyltransferase family 2 protein [Planctomycetota bacterium]|nr:glycosyltransferase family 2 protein [Planctomycetota bacterium]